MSKHELEGKFNPKDFEDEIYENWGRRGYLNLGMENGKRHKPMEIHHPTIKGG